MSIKIKFEVNPCQDCVYCSNTSKEHDDAFTSAPYPIQYFCKILEKNNQFDSKITELNKIHNNCPFKKNNVWKRS